MFAATLTACGGSARAPDVRDLQSNESATRIQEQGATSCLQAPAIPQLPAGGLIDVTDFGAVPDDDGDDTVFIQRAISSARPGQWVYFPPGRYLQSKSLAVLQPGITLWGQGATIHATNPADQAIFLKADNSRIYGFTLTAVTQGRRSEPWTTRIAAFGLEAPSRFIRGIVIQGNRIVPAQETSGSPLSQSASAAGILLLAVRDFTVADNVVRRSLADGIHVTGGSVNGRVVGNHVSETGDDMIAMVSYLAKDWRQQMASQSGWMLRHREDTLVRNVWVSGNTVTDSFWGRGISVVGGEGVSIVNNDIARVSTAAGVLVARESGFHTHGVHHVVVQSNRISDVQTLPPVYVPSGGNFTDLFGLLSNNGGRTNHGAIEIHNLSAATELASVTERDVLGVGDIVVAGNSVRRAYRDGIRVGADSDSLGFGSITLVDNTVSGAASQAYENRLLGDVALPLTCSGNLQDGASADPRGCMGALSAPVSSGARLQCSAFPAP